LAFLCGVQLSIEYAIVIVFVSNTSQIVTLGSYHKEKVIVG
jgi:hypothetical protein